MEENEYKKRNILINYTKWLLKWIVILGVGFGILSAVFLWSQDYLKERKDRLVDVFAIECDAPEEYPEKHGYDKVHYLGKKKASDDVPSRLHRPAYNRVLRNGLTARDTVEQYDKVEYNSEEYGYKHDTSQHRINRETGEVTYRDLEAKNPKDEVLENCQIITPNEFYKRTGKILKKLQEKIKI